MQQASIDPRLRTAVEAMESIVDSGLASISLSPIDDNQVVAYDIAHVASAVTAARAILDYGTKGKTEGEIALALVAETAHDLITRVSGRETLWGTGAESIEKLRHILREGRDPKFLARLADGSPNHLGDDFELVAATFRRFADDRLMPLAGDIHRHNSDVPERLISELAALGVFGLSVPVEYGGSAEGGEHDFLGMIVATEELSRASLGAGGSLMTRPEILTRALVAGGTSSQRNQWLPEIASGAAMVAVAVTEPDRGSDVAGLRCSATPAPDGGWYLSGTKTWCTFAGRADLVMLLARTDPTSTDHRGLSLFVVSKPRTSGHSFDHRQQESERPAGGEGRMRGRAIDTIGYRGMHSFEISFDNWWIPGESLVGGSNGVGRGFYLQMSGFESGRLQTAARAVGVMQAAYEAALSYSAERVVFGRPVADYQLTRVKLGRMAVLVQASRQFSLHVAHLMGSGDPMAGVEASMVKAYACRAAEWVTREAMQIHGGMGYAEEYDVSRYFVDARVLSIFEGTDETLCLKVIIRRLLDERVRSAN